MYASLMYASLNRAIIGPDNGLSPVRGQAGIWRKIAHCKHFIVDLIETQQFSKEINLKTSLAK